MTEPSENPTGSLKTIVMTPGEDPRTAPSAGALRSSTAWAPAGSASPANAATTQTEKTSHRAPRTITTHLTGDRITPWPTLKSLTSPAGNCGHLNGYPKPSKPVDDRCHSRRPPRHVDALSPVRHTAHTNGELCVRSRPASDPSRGIRGATDGVCLRDTVRKPETGRKPERSGPADDRRFRRRVE